jgi:uncharacterized protein (DUF302 family)
MQAVEHQVQVTSFTTNRIIASSVRSFEQVVQKIEELTGRFDNQAFVEIVRSQQSVEQVKQAAKAMTGESGFMIFSVLEHGKLLSLGTQPQKAKLYILGNPLIAREMFQEDASMGLYVPLRLFVYESEGDQTCLAYDQPSSLLSQFENQKINAIAASLDQKLELIVSKAL